MLTMTDVYSMLSRTIAYNQLDRSFDPPVNRVSHLGPYKILDGLPL